MKTPFYNLLGALVISAITSFSTPANAFILNELPVIVGDSIPAQVTAGLQNNGGTLYVVITGNAAGITATSTFLYAQYDTLAWLTTAYTYGEQICEGTGPWNRLSFGQVDFVSMYLSAIGGPPLTILDCF